MILDAIACGLVILWQLSKVVITGVLLQGLIYRLTGISLYNTMKTGIEKEIAPTKVLSLKK